MPLGTLARLRSLSLCHPVGGVEIIAVHHRMHALCNEIGPFGVGLLALGFKPDIVAGVVRHYVRNAIEDRGNEHQCQERPDFLHGAYPMSFVLPKQPSDQPEVCCLWHEGSRTASEPLMKPALRG